MDGEFDGTCPEKITNKCKKEKYMEIYQGPSNLLCGPCLGGSFFDVML